MIVNSSLCYIIKEDCYLMLHRVKKDNDINKDKWIGIGGKLEDGESPYDCVIRETMEETALRLIRPDYRGIVTFVTEDGYTEQMHLFTCDNFSGEIGECSEGELEWVKKEDVFSLPIWEGDKIFLRLIAKNMPFFSLKLVYSGERLVLAVLNGRNEEDLRMNMTE